jgi:hypothetical protein
MEILIPIIAIIAIFSYAAYTQHLAAQVSIATARGAVLEPEDPAAAANRAILEKLEALGARLDNTEKKI